MEIAQSVLKWLMVFVCFGFVGLSISYPISFNKNQKESVWEKVLFGVFLLNLLAVCVLFFQTFSTFWGVCASLLLVSFAIWILRENQIIEIRFNARYAKKLEFYPLERLHMYFLSEKWEKVPSMLDDLGGLHDPVLQKRTIFLLLSKSYAHIKMNQVEEAMDILFLLLDYDVIDWEVRETIQYQLEIIQKNVHVA